MPSAEAGAWFISSTEKGTYFMPSKEGGGTWFMYSRKEGAWFTPSTEARAWFTYSADAKVCRTLAPTWQRRELPMVLANTRGEGTGLQSCRLFLVILCERVKRIVRLL